MFGAKCYDKAYAVARQCNADKHLRERLFTEVKEGYLESLPEEERDERRIWLPVIIMTWRKRLYGE